MDFGYYVLGQEVWAAYGHAGARESMRAGREGGRGPGELSTLRRRSSFWPGFERIGSGADMEVELDEEVADGKKPAREEVAMPQP